MRCSYPDIGRSISNKMIMILIGRSISNDIDHILIGRINDQMRWSYPDIGCSISNDMIISLLDIDQYPIRWSYPYWNINIIWYWSYPYKDRINVIWYWSYPYKDRINVIWYWSYPYKDMINLIWYWSYPYWKINIKWDHHIHIGYWSISNKMIMILIGRSISNDIDHILIRIWSISFDIDPILIRIWSISFDIDHILIRIWPISFDIDHILIGRSISNEIISFDYWKINIQWDGHILIGRSISFDIDHILIRIGSISFDIDHILIGRINDQMRWSYPDIGRSISIEMIISLLEDQSHLILIISLLEGSMIKWDDHILILEDQYPMRWSYPYWKINLIWYWSYPYWKINIKWDHPIIIGILIFQ